MASPSESKDQSPIDLISVIKDKQTNNMASTPDPELDAILDSALADFEKADEPETKKPTTEPSALAPPTEKTEQGQEPQAVGFDPDDGLPDDTNYDFLSDAMTKQFEECFGSLMKDPNVKRQFEDLSKSAEQAAFTNNPTDFAETVEKALSGLSLNADNLQGDPNQQELWEQLAQSLGTEGAAGASAPEAGGAGGLPSSFGDMGAMGGMFQNMVQQLLSKEILYQPLKDVLEKYKDYLNENKKTLDPAKYEVYSKQFEVIEKVVEHVDGDSDDHSAEEKTARFEILLDLLQRMHELGNPPQEVVGDANMMMPNLSSLTGMGGLPGMGAGQSPGAQDPSQCSLM